MLNLHDVEEFEEVIRSGQLEDMFRYGSGEGRLEILELLEKIMDLGELADEVATRLIFRGLKAMPPVHGDMNGN